MPIAQSFSGRGGPRRGSGVLTSSLTSCAVDHMAGIGDVTGLGDARRATSVATPSGVVEASPSACSQMASRGQRSVRYRHLPDCGVRATTGAPSAPSTHDGEPDALAGARDDRDLVVQLEVRRLCSPSPFLGWGGEQRRVHFVRMRPADVVGSVLDRDQLASYGQRKPPEPLASTTWCCPVTPFSAARRQASRYATS
jgi:hypothetical protein